MLRSKPNVFHGQAPHTGERRTLPTFSTFKAAHLNHLRITHIDINIVD
jgi:hypothetical protein